MRPFLALILLALVGCQSGSNTSTTNAKPVVVVVNYPLKYFAERISGNALEIRFPVPTSEDPNFWKPDAAQVEKIQQADLILLNGADYAKWTTTASLPLAKTLDTSLGFKDRYIIMKDSITHSHGPSGEHTHSGVASYTWLDFQQAALQAKAISERFAKLRPELTSQFHQNLAKLEADLLELDAEMERVISSRNDVPVLASHPIYQYFERRYNLKLRSVHWEPDSVPEPGEWESLKKILATHPAKFMIWEAEPTGETVKKLEAQGVKSVVFSPCANVPESGDFLSVMRQNMANLKPVFAKP